MSDHPTTILCLASYFKGNAFMQQCKALGSTVYLLTREKFKDADWARESIDELFWMPDTHKQPDITYAVSYMMRSRKIDRIVPLDDYDVEVAANLREHLRIPGMGETTVRHFRDKLAMRVQARAEGTAFRSRVVWHQKTRFVRRIVARARRTRRPTVVLCVGKIHSRRCVSCGFRDLGR
jgi:hypothetical protein